MVDWHALRHDYLAVRRPVDVGIGRGYEGGTWCLYHL